MEITKREVFASIAIIAMMFVLGFIIGDKIQDRQNDVNAEYQKAVQIENNAELFQYGMSTNVGNAFVYGNLKAVDTVNFEEIGGEYLYVEKVEEHYNRHTRTVTKTRTVNGKTQIYTTTEVYYSWDYHDSWSKHSDKISFCGAEFDYDKIQTPSSRHLDTIKVSSKVRYKYYVVDVNHTGTIYTKLSDNTISDDSRFFENKNIEDALEACTFGIGIIIFWIFWVALSGAAVIGFYYLDNWWLED